MVGPFGGRKTMSFRQRQGSTSGTAEQNII
jgi:hypothetical protein